MFSMKRLLRLGAPLSKLNQYPTTTVQFQTPIQFQQCYFATGVTTPASGKPTTKKPKTKKTTKVKPKKEKAAKKAAKPAKKVAKPAKKVAKPAKKAKKAKKVAKPKPFMATLSKKDKKLLKRFPDPKKPDRALTGYNSFVSQQFENNVGMTIRECGKLWNELNENEKMRYKSEVLPEAEKYKADIKKYKLKQDESVKAWLAIMKNLTDERPPKSGFTGYVQENKHIFKEHGGVRSGTAVKEVASQWKQLSDYERDSYNSKYSGMYQDWKDKVDSEYI